MSSIPALTSPLKVALCGLDIRSTNMLDMFFKGPAKGACVVVHEEDADAGIVDMDSAAGEHLWQEFRRRFHGPALVLSVQERQLHNAVWVEKPIETQEFLAALGMIRQRLTTEERLRQIESDLSIDQPPPATDATETVPAGEAAPGVEEPAARFEEREAALGSLADRVAAGARAGRAKRVHKTSRAAALARDEQHVHECCGDLEDSVYRDPAQRGKLTYVVEDYLQGVLHRVQRQAREQDSPMLLEGLGRPLVVFPDGRRMYTEMRESYLRPLCVATPRGLKLEVRPMAAAELPLVSSPDANLHNFEAFLWKVALWAARGRIPAGTDPHAPVAMRAWPNFTRFHIPPHGMQIAALWANRSVSLRETADILGIPCRYVYALYSACHALGLAEVQAKGEAAGASGPPAGKARQAPGESDQAPPKRSLLGNLLRKLKSVF